MLKNGTLCSNRTLLGTVLVLGVAASSAAGPAPSIQRLVVSPATTVPGGAPCKAEVWLTDAAVVDTKVKLESSDPRVASVPRGIVVPAGRQVGRFAVTTVGVSQTVRVRLRADDGSSTVGAALAVTPPELYSVRFRPDVITVEQHSTASIVLQGIAPAGGWSVALEQQPQAACHFLDWIDTTQPQLELPDEVTVPAGENRVSFEVVAQSLPEHATSCDVTITASAGGDSYEAVLRVSAGLQAG